MWKRVIAPTVVLILLWIPVGGVTTYYISWLTDANARVLRENVTTIQSAGQLLDTLWRLQSAVAEAGTSSNPEDQRRIDELVAAFEQVLSNTSETAYTPDEQVLVQLIGEQFSTYLGHVRRRTLPASDSPAESTATANETRQAATVVAASCQDLLLINETILGESTARMRRVGAAIHTLRMGFIVVGPLTGLLLGIWIARRLHFYVSRISVNLQDAAGTLHEEIGRVEVAPSADLPGLDEQVQAVAAQIRKVLDELHRARREAMQAERLAAVGELAAGVAHELRNPLTSVKLLIQTAAQRPPGRALGERPLQIVLQEIQRMERTIQGLLDFARPPRLHRVRHDVRETLQRALNLVVGRAAQQEVTVQTDLPPTPVDVEADPEQLHQVFVNLLLNSMDSMANGGLLRIALEAQAIRGGTCRIVFSDSGLGIPDAVLERLFEPFVTTKDRGTGLGLAISRRIVEEHHGRIVAANCGGQGASFTVELPLAAGPSGGSDVAGKPVTDCTATRSGEGTPACRNYS